MKKIALVTGGSRGIGAATVLKLAQSGYDVCVNYRSNSAEAEKVLSEAKAFGVKAISVQADVSIEADVIRLFETVDAELGHLTTLVNNAGIIKSMERVVEMNAERLNQTFAVNITGAFLCAKEAIKRMSIDRGGKGGSIVNVSSAAARLGSAGEYVDYAASKGAIDSMTIGLSKELAMEGIRVNAVRPGFIETDIHAPGRINSVVPNLPMKRAGKPEEVANAIAWLLSDEASYVTGTFIDAAGGR